MISEWDERRSIRRGSKYASFGIDDKKRFLADLALVLVKEGLVRFSESDLAEAYKAIAGRYRLPTGQARMVAKELETHTGLLHQVGTHYEYCHLSLQEFLAADSLLRGGRATQLDWWQHSPAVGAIAVAMASDANAVMLDLASVADLDERTARSFLYRLGHEQPRFERSVDLGRWILGRLRHQNDPSTVARLHESKPIRDSVFDAMAEYTSVKVVGNRVRLAQYSPAGQVLHALEVEHPVLETLLGGDRLRQATTR